MGSNSPSPSRLLRSAAFLLLLVSPARAGDETDGLRGLSIEELMRVNVRVASVTASTLLKSPSTVTIIDQDTIRLYNIQTVAEAIELVANMSVVRTYFKWDLPTARGILQDHYANRVLLMIDNVPTWMAVTGEAEIGRVDIEDVDRIEVLKGPASVLYGTNAYAGAINIVLKTTSARSAANMHGTVSQNIGFMGGGSYAFSSDEKKVRVFANALSMQGASGLFTDELGVAANVDNFLRGGNATVKAQIDNHSLLVNVYRKEESFLGAAPSFSLGAGKEHNLRGYLANYSYSTRFLGRHEATFGLTYDWNERNFPRSADNSSRSNVQGYRATAFATAVLDVSDPLKIEAGFQWEYRRSVEYTNYDPRSDVVTADNNMDGRSVRAVSLFVQGRYDRGPLGATLGARYSHNQLFGGDVCGRGTFVYALSERTSAKLIVGQSYRAPSLFELYFTTQNRTVYGNPDLVPEKSSSVEISYLRSFSSLFLEAVAYRARYSDKTTRIRRYPIYTSDPEDPSLIYVNGSPFDATGLEVNLKYQRARTIDAFLSYGFIDGNSGDEIPGTEHFNFKYVARHTLAAGASKQIGDWAVAGVFKLWSSRGTPSGRLDTQSTLDLTVSFDQRLSSTDARHALSIKDLFDTRVVYPDYVRQTLEEVPSGLGRRASYTVTVAF